MKYNGEDVIIVPVSIIRELQKEVLNVSQMVKNVTKELKELKISRDTKSEKEWMSPEEAADYIGISRKTINNYGRRNIISSYKTGKTRMFKRKDLDEYLGRGFEPSNQQVEDEALMNMYM